MAWAALLGVTVGLLGGCSTRDDVLPPEARVQGVEVRGDGTEVAFSIDLCRRPLLELTVEETDDQVRVLARSERGPDPADCALEVTRHLDQPLGDRVVVDSGTGEIVTRVDDLTD